MTHVCGYLLACVRGDAKMNSNVFVVILGKTCRRTLYKN